MFLIIWEYQIKAAHLREFEEIYSADGTWTRLFQKSKAFLGTELIRDEKDPRRYLTIDRWTSAQGYELFRFQWNAEYAALDAQCERLTEEETLLGKWETVFCETR